MTVAAYRTFFNLSDGELTAMQAYLQVLDGAAAVLRIANVGQQGCSSMAAQHTNIAMDADSLGWPACEMYSQQVTRRLSRAISSR